jgi:hypothetical protein
MWLAIEAHVAVICASAPALKIFFKHTLNSSTFRGQSAYTRKRLNDSDNSGPSLEKGYMRPVRKMDQWDVSMDDEHELTNYGNGKVETIITSGKVHPTFYSG